MAGRIDLEVKQALHRAAGNRQQAQKDLLRTVLSDDELLRELVAPFLKPITAQAIDRALRDTTSSAPAARTRPMNAASKAVAGQLLGSPYNPMKAATAADTPVPQRPAASSRHVSTIKLLAAAYQIKRGERV